MKSDVNRDLAERLDAAAAAWGAAAREALGREPSPAVRQRIHDVAATAARRRLWWQRARRTLAVAAMFAVAGTVAFLMIRQPAPHGEAAPQGSALEDVLLLAEAADYDAGETVAGFPETGNDFEALARRLLAVQGFVDDDDIYLISAL